MKLAPNRWWDWTAVLCFLAGQITVSYRLIDTKWTEDLNLVMTLAILGAVIGLLLGASRFDGPVLVLLGLGYSAAMLSWQMTHAIQGDAPFLEKLISVGGRLRTSFNLFLHNDPITDPILFLANMSLLFWVAAMAGGYNLTRYGKPWISIIITGITIMVIDIYHPAAGVQGAAMALYTVLALLLLARMNFLRRKREWEGEEISVDGETGFSWGRAGLITATVLVILAWNINSTIIKGNPVTAENNQPVNWWNDLRGRIENLVDPLRGTTVVPREYFGETFSLGTGSQLSEREVFSVEPNIGGHTGVPYYWRVRTYDRYAGGYWESTINETLSLAPSFTKIEYAESFRSRTAIRFRFYPQRNLNMLYAPSMPLAFSRPVKIMPDLMGEEPADVTSVTISPMVRAGETYEMVSMIASPTVLQLQQAGTIYPEWTDKYLQLPDDMPQSIRDLAEEITAGLENPYDQAVAVTMWLRVNIEYKQVLPAVPLGKDPIEWMLFDQKQAFCNYYATAEVLMLRHLGIPARWAAGYAQGMYNPESKAYIVREADSHAWPEVYFPNYGWVEFEPTASEVEIARPSGLGDPYAEVSPPGTDLNPDEARRGIQENDELAGQFDNRSGAAPTIISVLRFIGVGGAVLIVILFAILILDMRRRNSQKSFPVVIEKTMKKRGWKVPAWVREWSRFVRLSPMARVFIQLEWILRILGKRVPASATPSEQAYLLISAMPQGETQVKTLLEEYQKDIYSPRHGEIETAKEAIKKLWIMALKDRVKAFGAWFYPAKKTTSPAGPVKPE